MQKQMHMCVCVGGGGGYCVYIYKNEQVFFPGDIVLHSF